MTGSGCGGASKSEQAKPVVIAALEKTTDVTTKQTPTNESGCCSAEPSQKSEKGGRGRRS